MTQRLTKAVTHHHIKARPSIGAKHESEEVEDEELQDLNRILSSIEKCSASQGKDGKDGKDEKDEKDGKGEPLLRDYSTDMVVTFKGGPNGITCDKEGIVKSIKSNSEASEKNIQAGYRIAKVDHRVVKLEKQLTEGSAKSMMAAAEKTGQAYSLTFVQDSNSDVSFLLAQAIKEVQLLQQIPIDAQARYEQVRKELQTAREDLEGGSPPDLVERVQLIREMLDLNEPPGSHWIAYYAIFRVRWAFTLLIVFAIVFSIFVGMLMEIFFSQLAGDIEWDTWKDYLKWKLTFAFLPFTMILFAMVGDQFLFLCLDVFDDPPLHHAQAIQIVALKSLLTKAYSTEGKASDRGYHRSSLTTSPQDQALALPPKDSSQDQALLQRGHCCYIPNDIDYCIRYIDWIMRALFDYIPYACMLINPVYWIIHLEKYSSIASSVGKYMVEGLVQGSLLCGLMFTVFHMFALCALVTTSAFNESEMKIEIESCKGLLLRIRQRVPLFRGHTKKSQEALLQSLSHAIDLGRMWPGWLSTAPHLKQLRDASTVKKTRVAVVNEQPHIMHRMLSKNLTQSRTRKFWQPFLITISTLSWAIVVFLMKDHNHASALQGTSSWFLDFLLCSLLFMVVTWSFFVHSQISGVVTAKYCVLIAGFTLVLMSLLYGAAMPTEEAGNKDQAMQDMMTVNPSENAFNLDLPLQWKPQSVSVAYPVCRMEFGSANAPLYPLDLANLAWIIYDATPLPPKPRDFSKSSIQRMLDRSFSSNYKATFVNGTTYEKLPRWGHFYFPPRKGGSNGTRVFAVKGTSTPTDAFYDTSLFATVQILQFFQLFLPVLTVLPRPFIQFMLAYAHLATSSKAAALVWENLEKAITDAKKQYPDDEFVLTGHSLGGGLAQIASSKLAIPALVWSAPGAVYSAKYFNITVEATKQNVVSVMPDHDAVPRVDLQAGTIQQVECRNKDGSEALPHQCHPIRKTACEIWRLCGDDRDFRATCNSHVKRSDLGRLYKDDDSSAV